MSHTKQSLYILKFIWFLGLIGLAYGGYYLERIIDQQASRAFDPLPLFWLHALIPLVFGLYISLIFVKKWSYAMNKPLFYCITIPCLAISLAFPLIITFEINFPYVFRFHELNYFGIFSMVSGVTILPSFFKNHESSYVD